MAGFLREFLSDPERLASLGLMALLLLGILLRRAAKRAARRRQYTAPSWNQRRTAILNPGGASYDLRHYLPVTARRSGAPCFRVGRDLEVDGETLTLRPGRRGELRFTPGEIASVVTASAQGVNALCDQEGNPLFTFRWDEKNAALLAQYLIDHGVRFIAYIGKGLYLAPELYEFPPHFTAGPLEVDGETIRFRRSFGRSTAFPVSEVDHTALRLPKERVDLLDREGKVLGWFLKNGENGDYMHNYLVQSLDLKNKERTT